MAYEGLISDWSSDVCSSDLDRRLVRRRCRLALDDGIRLDDAKFDRLRQRHADRRVLEGFHGHDHAVLEELHGVFTDQRSEERRVGEERVNTGRSRWAP